MFSAVAVSAKHRYITAIVAEKCIYCALSALLRSRHTRECHIAATVHVLAMKSRKKGWWAAHTCCDAQHQQQDARHAALGDQCTGATCSCAAQKSKPNAFDCLWHSWHRVRQHPYTSSTCCVCGLRMSTNPTPASRQKAEDVRFGTAHPGARHTATSARAALK